MANLQIAVLGAGNIGGALGRKWGAAGHTIVFGLANPTGEKAQALKADLGEKAVIKTIAEAIQGAEVVVFAIPGKAMDATITANAGALNGKLVIDVANRVGEPVFNSYATFERVAPTVRYARAFNTLGWENYVDPTFAGGPADLFYAAPEDGHLTVEALISDMGYHPVRLGDSDQADLVDSLLRLWFTLTRTYGRRFAFKIVTAQG
ncbi:MAG TPA: NAD(P)-binding domain-containing protein [Ktedonobacterales bacterium]|nr:NAD(P)-binding domain-containing protein [Ktedonobacterales bacterium]